MASTARVGEKRRLAFTLQARHAERVTAD